jgi:hypothetical protein
VNAHHLTRCHIRLVQASGTLKHQRWKDGLVMRLKTGVVLWLQTRRVGLSRVDTLVLHTLAGPTETMTISPKTMPLVTQAVSKINLHW